MRKLFVCVLVFVPVFLFAQQVPQKVKQALTRKFPKLENVVWKKNEDRYKATFSKDDLKHVITFSSSGKLLQSQSEIEFDDLPEKVRNVILRSYPESYFLESWLVQYANGKKIYMIELEYEGELINMTIDETGQIVLNDN